MAIEPIIHLCLRYQVNIRHNLILWNDPVTTFMMLCIDLKSASNVHDKIFKQNNYMKMIAIFSSGHLSAELFATIVHIHLLMLFFIPYV